MLRVGDVAGYSDDTFERTDGLIQCSGIAPIGDDVPSLIGEGSNESSSEASRSSGDDGGAVAVLHGGSSRCGECTARNSNNCF